MKGFADKCLLLFPKPEVYEFKSETYYINFQRSIVNLLDYLDSINVEVHCFTTDEIALMNNPRNVHWIQTLCTPDDFFMRTHNEAMSNLKFKKEIITLPDLYKEVTTKITLERGLTEEQRFAIISKREHYVTKELISNYKLIFSIHQASNQAYKVTSKLGDGKIRVLINNGTFQCSCYLSGEEIDSNDLLNFSGANRPIYTWRNYR